MCFSTDGNMLAVTKGQVFAVLDTSSPSWASWLLYVTNGRVPANREARQDGTQAGGLPRGQSTDSLQPASTGVERDVAEKFVFVVEQEQQASPSV